MFKSKSEVEVGSLIHIFHMFGNSEYRDAEGMVEYIHDNEIYGTWGDDPLFFNDDWEIVEI